MRIPGGTVACWLTLGSCFAAEPIDFNRDVRPILSEFCFTCHGPDGRGRKADLRLDQAESAREDRGGHAAIVPKSLAKSELWQRLHEENPARRMPPASTKKRLSAKDIATLKAWIEQGAEFAGHWAFTPPRRPAVPDGGAEWARNPIDRFIHARLVKQGLDPSPPAEPERWLRRVHLDLIGIPPTPAEVKTFDTQLRTSGAQGSRIPQAILDNVVDRLLASPRFGERWAVPWLDQARYADSNGYQADQLREIWAYRDWVIQAFNRDMPFDQFVVEQLAGDLLPNATLPQKVATGFHRTVTCNVEAGVNPEENRVNQVFDRVNTTATVFLGLSFECAQCHDHKYDPISMKDYYRFFAYFNNTPLEVKLPKGTGVQYDLAGPKLDLPLSATDEARRVEIQGRIDRLTQDREAVAKKLRADQAAWESKLKGAGSDSTGWQVLTIRGFESTGGEDHEILDDQSVLVTGRLPDTSIYTLTTSLPKTGLSSLKIEALTHERILGSGPGRADAERTNFILSEIKVTLKHPSGKLEPIPLRGGQADFSQKGWDVNGAIDGDRKTGWAIAPAFHQPHWASFSLQKPVTGTDEATLVVTLDQNFGRGRTLGRVRLSARSESTAAPTLPDAVIVALAKVKRSSADQKVLDDHFLAAHPALVTIDREIDTLRRERDNLKATSTLVMTEMPQPRVTTILNRGNYLTPGPRVEPGAPEILGASGPSLPPNRLGLAHALTSPSNPLLARVTVNRWWAEIFGRGIVATVEEFGSQGEQPTHPELLDWLATEFQSSGWSMKHILKLIVTSATYGQSSRVSPGLADRDPDNRWLSHGPRFRLRAEMIRDAALSASGLLSPKMHGPPVMPYQPPGLWRTVGRNSPVWVEKTDEDRFRRGVYVVWRRAVPYPSFVTFDAPDRSSCVVKRSRTNTPLQALTLLNDPAYVEMALALAQRIELETPGRADRDRVVQGWRLTLTRTPTAEETDTVLELFRNKLAHFTAHPQKARELVDAIKGVRVVPGVDVVRLAAWFHVANVLLNLDETITKG